MTYDFDKVINRRGTDSLKFDRAGFYGKPADVLPLWVADMDFPAPDVVLDAIHERVSHGIFGYSEPDAAYFAALENWFTRRLGYEFSSDWVTLTSGVVYAIAMAIRAFTKRGEAVLIQEPVYYPFRQMVVHNGRKLVVNELKLHESGEKYIIDFAEFER
ncbi:MAG: aminotransferase class I/II-fold pyridoxal phosphate-dependent enzyme, partial [Defluviitaleaceae bacterium]|nr:aminotransferase class I/II-fold pyridoxal phosphate-dependent enzyme [Defluviitaleaceae bacterium]